MVEQDYGGTNHNFFLRCMVLFYFPHDTFLCAHSTCLRHKGTRQRITFEHVSININ